MGPRNAQRPVLLFTAGLETSDSPLSNRHRHEEAATFLRDALRIIQWGLSNYPRDGSIRIGH